MTTKMLYLYTITKASEVVGRVDAEHLSLPTPDTEWNVRELLQHMVYELAWTADTVYGRTLAEVGDKYEHMLFHGNPVELWRRFQPRTVSAVETCNEELTAHLSYGDTAIVDYLLEAGNDQLVHTWDLGRSIGVPVEFDKNIAKNLYDRAQDRVDEFAASGLFAPPIEVSESADIQTKLLALLGRNVKWTANV